MQLEKVVGKNVATAISNTATNLARQESHDLESPTSSSIQFWTGQITPGPSFVRSDSILADDDYVPYDAPCISKYGPISRMHKDNVQMNQVSYRDGSNSMARRPVSAPSPVAYWYNNSAPQQFHQAAISNGHLVASHGAGMGDGFIINGTFCIGFVFT